MINQKLKEGKRESPKLITKLRMTNKWLTNPKLEEEGRKRVNTYSRPKKLESKGMADTGILICSTMKVKIKSWIHDLCINEKQTSKVVSHNIIKKKGEQYYFYILINDFYHHI